MGHACRARNHVFDSSHDRVLHRYNQLFACRAGFRHDFLIIKQRDVVCVYLCKKAIVFGLKLRQVSDLYLGLTLIMGIKNRFFDGIFCCLDILGRQYAAITSNRLLFLFRKNLLV